MKKYKTLYTVSAVLLSSALVGCGGSSSSSSSPEASDPGGQESGLSGVVRNYYTGEPISGALVTLNASGLDEPLRVTSGDRGAFSFEAPEQAGRATVSGRATGFGSSSLVTSTAADADNDSLELSLLPAQLTTTFAGDTGASLEVEGRPDIAVLPPNAFGTNGTPYTGTVNGQVTILNPASDPSIIPGAYTILDENGQPGLLTTFGAVTFDFTDENGNPLQLNSGTPVTIRIPLADGINSSNAPASVPLAWFDETTGDWVQEGEASLVGSYYEGTVTHFTTWNTVDVYTPVDVTGRVVDGAGNPVAGAEVRAQGYDYIGMNTVLTRADGTFSLPVRANSEILISAYRNTTSNTREVEVGSGNTDLENDLVLSDSAVSITLTWGQNPSDLDSHLLGPADESDTSDFHVAYYNQIVTVGNTTIELDVDDVTSFGPEVVTIPSFPYAGRYRYLVHLFSGSGTIANSPARVEFSIGGQTQIFSPQNAQGSVSDWWAVADLVVDEAGNVRLDPVQQWREDEGERYSVSGFSLNSITNPATTAAKRKYYSEAQ